MQNVNILDLIKAYEDYIAFLKSPSYQEINWERRYDPETCYIEYIDKVKKCLAKKEPSY